MRSDDGCSYFDLLLTRWMMLRRFKVGAAAIALVLLFFVAEILVLLFFCRGNFCCLVPPEVAVCLAFAILEEVSVILMPPAADVELADVPES